MLDFFAKIRTKEKFVVHTHMHAVFCLTVLLFLSYWSLGRLTLSPKENWSNFLQDALLDAQQRVLKDEGKLKHWHRPRKLTHWLISFLIHCLTLEGSDSTCLFYASFPLLNFALFFVMAALCSRWGHYIFALWFLLSSFFFSTNLSCRRLDVYHTSTHGVALVRI